MSSAPPHPAEKTTHWREDKVGMVLSMKSEVHPQDPALEIPEWLATAEVVADIAKRAARDEQTGENDPTEARSPDSLFSSHQDEDPCDWRDLAPELLSRDVIAGSESADVFGHHLEWKAWDLGVHAAQRQAFVADGLAVNWTSTNGTSAR